MKAFLFCKNPREFSLISNEKIVTNENREKKTICEGLGLMCALFATILFSLPGAALQVSFLHSPDCPHCVKMEPEWEKLVNRFNESGIEFQSFDLTTPEGRAVAQALGNRFIPAVYFGVEKALEGERSDFADYLSRKICQELNDSASPCPIPPEEFNPLFLIIPASIIFGAYAYKQGWLKR
jgi:thiol-disulfide isomerase/thioredoxin